MKRTTLIFAVVSCITVGAGVVFGLNHKSPPMQATPPGSTNSNSTSAASQSASTAPTFDKNQYSLSDPKSIWIVVDKQRPLNPKDYAPADLTTIGNGQYLRAEAAAAYQKLVTAAKAAGYTLIPESGYRSYNTQVTVYDNEVKNFGQTVADSESARPGYSEHQTGWAVDIATPGCMEDCFGNTEAAKWTLAHAADYGFIRRYAPDKSSVTGYRTEPWHFRYVGTLLSAELIKTGQALEEFFGLSAAPNY